MNLVILVYGGSTQQYVYRCDEKYTFWGVFVEPSQRGETGLIALLGLARVRKYSNLVHLEHCVSTGQDVCILDRKYVILGCILRRMPDEGKGSYCTFWPRARKEI